MSLPRLLRIFFLTLFFLHAHHSAAWCAPDQVKDLIQQLEKRQGDWIAFKAHITLEASRIANPPASCEGELAYERLNEKMMLLCVGTKKDLLFAFKSEDKTFQFYQPASGVLYHGSIFDLEDDPQMNSHIQPLQLYRALKLNSISGKNARIESRRGRELTLTVNGMSHQEPYLKRRLIMTASGDVPVETYYRPDGKVDVAITRRSFKIQKKQGLSGQESYVFPKKVTLEEPQKTEGNSSHRKTSLTFSRFEFNPEIAFKDWELPVPADTKRINVSEGFEKIEKAAQD
ncbi:MAG: hypothetical protein EXS63_07930 [Candidatus Omnitrophica bacterium]|nr:hypothetical protein [Candidatus Omnitrophota bacterium]